MPFEGSWGKVIFSEACIKNSVHIREQCMLGDTSNKRAVRIVLECIFVFMKFMKFHYPEVFNSFKDF